MTTEEEEEQILTLFRTPNPYIVHDIDQFDGRLGCGVLVWRPSERKTSIGPAKVAHVDHLTDTARE